MKHSVAGRLRAREPRLRTDPASLAAPAQRRFTCHRQFETNFALTCQAPQLYWYAKSCGVRAL